MSISRAKRLNKLILLARSLNSVPIALICMLNKIDGNYNKSSARAARSNREKYTIV